MIKYNRIHDSSNIFKVCLFSYRAEGGAARQQFGMFIVSPTSGTVIVGGSITINVDCITEQEGKGDEVSCFPCLWSS